MTLVSNIHSLESIQKMINQNDFYLKKSLGQNFLIDNNIAKKMAQNINCNQRNILEIGPGLGSLTRELLIEGSKSIIGIEKDYRAIKLLEPLIMKSDGKLKVIHGDAKKTNLSSLEFIFDSIVGNLPYNISTFLILSWLEEIESDRKLNFIKNITVTIQKEVAERIVAKPGTKSFGRLSLIMDLLSRPKLLFNISPDAFQPKPQVISTLINIQPLNKPKYQVKLKTFLLITKLAFNQRRKMLRQSLKSISGRKILFNSGIDDSKRAENLSTEEFCNLSNCYDQMSKI